MKAQTFKIMGSQSLLEAMWKELLSIGYQKLKDSKYTMEDKIYNNTYFICINDTLSPERKDKETFTYLYFGNLGGIKMDKHFNLPEQYNEALEFAKEQLKPKYWKETFNFEIGKWYYFEAYGIKWKTFAKCKGIDDTGFDCTDWIVNDTLYRNGKWCYEDMHNIREATLEEIQQYLPDGHPDKKYIPKKGDYIYHDHGNYGWIVIFSEINNVYVIGEQCITGKNSNSFYMSYRNSNNNSELRPATQEEKQWLDACIKAGKFISKEEALETEEDRLLKEAKKRYPVGTKFRVAHQPSNICEVTSHEKYEYTFVKDSIGELHINFLCKHISPIDSLAMGASVYFNGKWAEIIPEVKKWDVGTYIVYIKGSYGYNPEMGQIMQIIKNESNIDGTIKTEEQGYCKIDREGKGEIKWFATKEEAEEFAKTLIPQLSVGDYIISERYIKHIGRITEIYNDGTRYRYWGYCVTGQLRVSDWYNFSGTKPRKASSKEIEEFLTNVAKHKYSVGVWVDQAVAYPGVSKEELQIKSTNVEVSLYSAENFINVAIGGVGVFNTKYNIWAPIIPAPSIDLPFGELTFTIDKGSRLVTSIHGKITFDEIISLHKKIEILQSVELLGHTCTIPTIKFGCQEGTFKQLEAIYNAIKCHE